MPPGNYRIIAGEWRGRRLPIPDLPGLRPTPDRVRETLFNWLAPTLPGARCLDLFAGAGALGFEAASRGAGHVMLVDRERAVTELLRQEAVRLNAANVEIAQSEVLAFLRDTAEPCDIVFLDPPYAAQLLPATLALLHEGAWVKTGGWVYIEHDAREKPPELPIGWRYHRSKRAAQVGYHLVEAG
ncbi:MAG: 16S rRNA (guanine(966)-N(2))-methyltransferase RsmD [Proteobacteria bacterium]|nr:MAG: 16S rRNA (guanine(966)-N(2))-methyltransferase RsmD [Pseudomonadota bacterium]QKK12574.1 MAG: 16S rRNA (guanine(966)-N(2))-methyltransferase RsmD [Pseudomonadota bacterium]